MKDSQRKAVSPSMIVRLAAPANPTTEPNRVRTMPLMAGFWIHFRYHGLWIDSASRDCSG